MGYYLQALIGTDSVLRDTRFASAKVVSLAQGLCMVPVTDELFDVLQATFPQKEDPYPRFEKLSAAIAEYVRSLSQNGLIVYIEAEFFGGIGGQSAIAWQQGKIALEPVHSQDAINQALKLLGVKVESATDEFEAIGLGQQRSTEDW